MAAGKCPQCNRSYGKGAQFCKKCGYSLALEEEKGTAINPVEEAQLPGVDVPETTPKVDVDAGSTLSDVLEEIGHESSSLDTPEELVRPTGALAVEIVNGLAAGTKLAISNGKPVVIGTDAAADLVLSDDYASRRHASLYFRDGRLMLSDAGSTNGTFVRVERAREIVQGDCFVVGNTCLRVVEEV